VRYRSAAKAAFDQDLRNNLRTLRGALLEEIEEARHPPAGEILDAGATPLQVAAKRALQEFRLNALYAEIRSGPDGGMPVARLPGAGLADDEPLVDDSTWRALSERPEAFDFTPGPGRRASALRFEVPGQAGTVMIAVADQTSLLDGTLASIRRAFYALGAGGLLLALVGGYWLASRALRPIDDLTRQASYMASLPSGAGPHQLDVPPLGDELSRLALTFNRLLARIDSSLTQTRTFLADAAHELKTPVAIVRTEAELALADGRSLEECREALRAIGAESVRLSSLISDLTLLAEGQLLEHPLEHRLVDLGELLQEVSRSLRPLATSRRIAVDVETSGPVELRCDERLVRRIATNLVENAIKFSPPESPIGIAVCGEDGRVELRIVDAAATLPAEERARVFDRFYRSQAARSGDVSGSGLGLAIARWAVELHGGRIRVEPRAQGGNVFIVELPASAQRELVEAVVEAPEG
jgi:signal transduction histidine kinase